MHGRYRPFQRGYGFREDGNPYEPPASTYVGSPRTPGMSTDLLGTVVVPIADPGDARETARAVGSYLDADAEIIVTHVVPKGDGVPDKAAVEQREGFAEEAYRVFRDELPDAVSVTPLTLYGRDVGATVVEGALEADATVIAYTPREMSRWLKLLTGSVASDIVENGELPVLVLPAGE